jgi:LacI family transcriptional regulator
MDDTIRRRKARLRAGSSISLDDVAAYARVSTASVSRVLNGVATVSADVRVKVEQACEALGYVPNGAARALAASRTMTIGAVVPTIENVGFATAVSTLQSSLKSAGYTLLLASSNYEASAEFNEVRLLLSRGIDGLMLVGGDHDPRLLPLIAQHGVPFVETWTLTSGRPCVGFDNVAAAYALADHLVGLGHTHIGLIAGVTDGNDRADARKRGLLKCLIEHGLRLDAGWFTERPYRVADGRTAMRSLIGAPKRPTAVICGNDQLALGALIEAHAQGLSVPRDISIAGFNDLEFAAHTNPSLTTVKIPAEDIGAEAAKLLLRWIDERTAPPSIEIPYTIMARGSTASPQPAG